MKRGLIDVEMSEKFPEPLRERTKNFAKSVIRLYSELDCRRVVVAVLGKQLLRSGTSVGANYREASRARSDAEFIAKIELCAQEADETIYWLELLKEECAVKGTESIEIEAEELLRIFVSMAIKTKQRRDDKKGGKK